MSEFLNQGAKFLLPQNSNYLKILKVFYEQTKITNQDFQNKEDIYNLCKKLKEFKEMEELDFDKYIQVLCSWGNLEKNPKLETVNKYEEFIKERKYYKITTNTIILLKAVEKIEEN